MVRTDVDMNTAWRVWAAQTVLNEMLVNGQLNADQFWVLFEGTTSPENISPNLGDEGGDRPTRGIESVGKLYMTLKPRRIL